MKTTLLSFLLSAIFLSFLLTACKKDPTKNAKLPPITQEGKNTIGFTIDGEVWVPYYKCRFMGTSCGEINAAYHEFGENSIDFMFVRQWKNSYSSLYISSAGPEPKSITTTGNKIDSIYIRYDDNELSHNGYFVGPMVGSKFMVTKIDFQTQIISGEFEFILREVKNSGIVTDNYITLKDGRFDFRLNACKCSN